jgi:hypothetical protein
MPILADDMVVHRMPSGVDVGTGAREFMNGYGPWPKAA